jgi:hypothetical protein
MVKATGHPAQRHQLRRRAKGVAIRQFDWTTWIEERRGRRHSRHDQAEQALIWPTTTMCAVAEFNLVAPKRINRSCR